MATHSVTCKQALPALTPQLHSITAVWLVLFLPSHGGWLVIYRNSAASRSRTRTQSPIPVLTGLSVG